MTGVEPIIGAGARVGATAAKPLWRKVRPDTSWSALEAAANELARSVGRAEKEHLNKLRAGANRHIDLTVRLIAGTEQVIKASEISAHYRDRPGPTRLVLLGDEGSGKSVLAIKLVMDQLEIRQSREYSQRSEMPVPVRVNASGWDGSEHFTDWMASRVARDYRLARRVAHALVENELIVPVVDGLEEMGPQSTAYPVRASSALDRLNESPWDNLQVVIACRAAAYEQMQEYRGDRGLHGAVLAVLQPLNEPDIRGFLQRYGDNHGVPDEAWKPLLRRSRQYPNAPLAAALRTPALLATAATAVRHRGLQAAEELASCTTRTQVRDYLFESVIPATVEGTERRGKSRQYTVENVQNWLTTLAADLEEQRRREGDGTQIALDEVWRIAGERRIPLWYSVASALIGFAVVSTAFGNSQGIAARITVGSVAAIGLGLGTIAAHQTVFAFAVRVPPRRHLRFAFLLAVSLAVTAGWVCGLMAGSALGFGAGVSTGVLVGGVCLVAGTVLFSLPASAAEQLARGRDEQRVIRDGLSAALLGAIPGGVVLGVLVGTTYPVMVKQLSGTTDIEPMLAALLGGLVGGILLTLVLGAGVGCYAMARFEFRRTGRFASDPKAFLHWARQVNLLRVTGIAYQFSQDDYKMWLAIRREPARNENG